MRQNRPHQRSNASNRGPGMGRMLLVSFGLHLAVVLIFGLGLFPEGRRELRPVVYIDLANLPVADPQAGRPDARPEPPPKAEAPASPPAVPRPEPPKPASKPEAKVEKPEPKVDPKPTPKPAAKPQPAPTPKPAPKAEPKPAPKPAPKVAKPAESYQDTLSAIDKLRREKERAELKERLAALASADGRGGTEAPLGEASGKGTESGVAHSTWLGEALKRYWSFSPYLSDRQDLEAKVKIFFDGEGKLLDYQFQKKSGSDQFDQSLVKAIINFSRDQILPNPPKERSSFEITFNLKDMKR